MSRVHSGNDRRIQGHCRRLSPHPFKLHDNPDLVPGLEISPESEHIMIQQAIRFLNIIRGRHQFTIDPTFKMAGLQFFRLFVSADTDADSVCRVAR